MEADDRVVLDQRVVERGGWIVAAGEADDDDPALEGDALGRALVGVATDRVEDDVRAASAGHRLDHRHEVLGVPVDDHVRAELAGHLGLVRTADDADDPRSRGLAELHRGPPDPAGGGVHEQGLARLQCRARCRANQPVW